jgi:hypothetical protein
MIALVSVSAFSQGRLSLIDWFAGADIVASSASSNAGLHSDFYVREFEFSAFSKIDQTFDGVLTLSHHNELEQGHAHTEVHEAFILSSQIFDLSTVKIGKFFLGFGRLNRFHRHDWVITEAPFVQKSFFGNEGAKDTGIEYKRNLPKLQSSMTFGLTSGNEFNHSAEHDHEEEAEHNHSKAKAPTGYLRYATFFELDDQKGVDIGLNVISRRDEQSHKYMYYGLDLIYKNKTGRFLSTLLQLEIWTRQLEHDDEKHTDSGAYVYLEKGINRHHALGVRLDHYIQDEREDGGEEHGHSVDGLEVEDAMSALSLSYTYTNSEFSKIRFTLEHGNGIHVEDSDTESYTRGLIQFVFNIGAHPAHVY